MLFVLKEMIKVDIEDFGGKKEIKEDTNFERLVRAIQKSNNVSEPNPKPNLTQ